jgi:hypothetical protein
MAYNMLKIELEQQPERPRELRWSVSLRLLAWTRRAILRAGWPFALQARISTDRVYCPRPRVLILRGIPHRYLPHSRAHPGADAAVTRWGRGVGSLRWCECLASAAPARTPVPLVTRCWYSIAGQHSLVARPACPMAWGLRYGLGLPRSAHHLLGVHLVRRLGLTMPMVGPLLVCSWGAPGLWVYQGLLRMLFPVPGRVASVIYWSDPCGSLPIALLPLHASPRAAGWP